MAPDYKSHAPSSNRGHSPVALKEGNNIKRRPSVSFQTPASSAQGQVEENGIEEDFGEEGVIADENIMDMLNILQEFQKKRSSKSSSRVAAIEAKKKAIKDLRGAEMHQMKQEGTAYIAQVQTRIKDLREQEAPQDSTFIDVAALFANQTKGVELQLETVSQFLSELSTERLGLVEENSGDDLPPQVRSHAVKLERIGKKVKKKAKKELQGGLEEQKLATEAQAYIKHFQHLVQI